jgi:hypothetical protein
MKPSPISSKRLCVHYFNLGGMMSAGSLERQFRAEQQEQSDDRGPSDG